MATHDPLTGLPNRTLMLDRGERMLSRARRSHAPLAALLIDLDNFTAINDTLGHAVGNELLRAIAARLDGVVRDVDALGRLGGDEFVLLAEEFSEAADAILIAARLTEALKAPFTLPDSGRTSLTVTASIGIASGERACVEDFLRDADIAMHRAKRDGENRHVLFESGMHDIVQSRMELDMALRSALEHDEFFLLYQPTLDLGGMKPTGVEALIRWNSRERGLVQPGDFIPLLEETGLVVEVGRWVLEEACRQGASWHARGHALGVAVNVSARQLETDEFVDDVRRALADSGLPSQSLTFEITETALMRNPEQTARRLRAIKGPRRARRDRRLRHRLLLLRPPQTVPRRRTQDRPLVRLADERQPRRRDAAAHTRAARQGAVDRDARRGHRAPAAAVAAARSVLRQRPGLPVRATAQRRGHRAVPGELAARRARARGARRPRRLTSATIAAPASRAPEHGRTLTAAARHSDGS
jgi:diguanylate cyclase (GGDEF)-like protein